MTFSRRRAVSALLGSATVAAWPHTWAQAYPVKPIRIVVPFGPGSATDTLARILADGLARELGQAVAIDNRPGAAAIIGAEAVAHSPPDGYTILLGSSQSHATNSSLIQKLPYDPLADFVPVARLTVAPAVLVVHQSIPARTVAEFIAYARQRSGQLNYATTGAGSQAHLQAAMLAATAGFKANHIPFKDAGQIFTAMARGDIHFMFYVYSALANLIQNGTLRVLASTGERRSPNTPDVPTMTEVGYPELTLAAWSAYYAPAGTPASIVDRLNGAVRKVLLENAEVRGKLATVGQEIFFGTPQQLGDFTRGEIDRYRKLVAITGVKVE